MNRYASAAILVVLFAFGLANALSYAECSDGFQNDPALEGGRTELEFADINDDGNVDILSIGDHGNPYVNTDEHGVMVWFGNGHGGWNSYQSGDFGYGGIAIGDVNGDGKWDIGYGMHHNYSGVDLGDDMLEVALGDGSGQNWTAWDDSLIPGGSVWGEFATDFADVDNDGDLDIGSTSFGYGIAVRVFLNNGDGTWHESFTSAGEVNNNIEFYFRDVNRDGNADSINAAAGPAVYFGDGQGGFVAGDNGLPTGGLAGISPGDVDNDGGVDVAFANSSGGIEVWVYDDSANLWVGFSGTLPATGDFEGTQLCDMNADGFVDLCAIGGGHLKVWLGDGRGNWSEATDITTPTPGYYQAFRTGADFDDNGFPDIIFVTEEGSWPSEQNVAHALKESSPIDSLTIFPVFPRGGENFVNGSVQFIDWWSASSYMPGAQDPERDVKLQFSAAGPSGPWQDISGPDGLFNNGRFQWTIPDSVTSANCYIRYLTVNVYHIPIETAFAVSPRAFTIGDTAPAVAEQPQAPSREFGATVVRGVLVLEGNGDSPSEREDARYSPHFPAMSRAVLLDIRGRKVMDLHPGANDVRALAPGVYFVRGEGRGAGDVGSIRKVVLMR